MRFTLKGVMRLLLPYLWLHTLAAGMRPNNVKTPYVPAKSRACTAEKKVLHQDQDVICALTSQHGTFSCVQLTLKNTCGKSEAKINGGTTVNTYGALCCWPEGSCGTNTGCQ